MAISSVKGQGGQQQCCSLLAFGSLGLRSPKAVAAASTMPEATHHLCQCLAVSSQGQAEPQYQSGLHCLDCLFPGSSPEGAGSLFQEEKGKHLACTSAQCSEGVQPGARQPQDPQVSSSQAENVQVLCKLQDNPCPAALSLTQGELQDNQKSMDSTTGTTAQGGQGSWEPPEQWNPCNVRKWHHMGWKAQQGGLHGGWHVEQGTTKICLSGQLRLLQ